MNYLAHTLLSCHDNDLLFGNAIADIVTNEQVSRLSQGVQRGVSLHRLVDTFTDNHELVKDCTKILHTHHGKYAPVVYDLLADFMLAQQWDSFSDVTIKEHVDMVYYVLTKNIEVLDDRPKLKMQRYIEKDFLYNCTDEDKLRQTMRWMDQRTKFPSEFEMAVDDYLKNKELFDEKFSVFFREMFHEANVFCGCDV